MEWRTRELLPDGRWQHYCIECNKPHTARNIYAADFDFKGMCDECYAHHQPRFQRLSVSQWE